MHESAEIKATSGGFYTSLIESYFKNILVCPAVNLRIDRLLEDKKKKKKNVKK